MRSFRYELPEFFTSQATGSPLRGGGSNMPPAPNEAVRPQPCVRSEPIATRGAVSLMAALLIATVGIAALVSIDVGHVFYSQRQLQKTVDLAALSGAQQLKRAADLPATTASVLGSVTAAAAQNGYASGVSAECADVAGGAADGLRACLGLWDPANPANGDSVRHFNPAYPAATVSPNAVRVQATYTVPLLFVIPGTASRQLRAEAIAAGSPPVASFTLGGGLLDVSTASGMLGLLLGNTVTLSVLDWSGLVGANVTLEQLRLQAGVGTIDQLLNASLHPGLLCAGAGRGGQERAAERGAGQPSDAAGGERHRHHGLAGEDARPGRAHAGGLVGGGGGRERGARC